MAIRAAYRIFGGGLTLLAGLFVLPGCELALKAVSERPPLLLEVEDIGPPTVELNTPLSISGSGFPERKEGELTLVGEVFVPGHEPKEVRVAIPAVSDSRSKAHATLSEGELLRLVQGARHATFVGSATLEFESPGAATPLVGEAIDVTLDLYSAKTTATTSSEAAPFPAFLGMTVTADLRVGSLETGGIAEQSGLALGDQLKSLDGVRLDSLEDLVPRARAKVSRFTVLREGEELVEVSVPRASFEPGLLPVATKVLLWSLSALLAILIAIRMPRYWGVITWEFRAKKRELESEGWAIHITLAAVIVLLWSSLFHPTSVLARVDLVVLLGVGVAFDLAATFARGGRAHASFSLVAGLRQLLGRLPQLMPLFASLLVAALDTGSLASSDLSRRSVEASLGLGALLSPWMLVLSAFAFVSLLPGPSRSSRPDSSAARYALAISLTAKSAVWATLFLWQSEGTGKLSSLLLSLKVSLTVIVAQLCARKLAALGLKSQNSLFPRFGLWISLVCVALGITLPRLRLFPLIAADVSQLSVWLLCTVVLVLLAAWLRGDNERGRALDPWA